MWQTLIQLAMGPRCTLFGKLICFKFNLCCTLCKKYLSMVIKMEARGQFAATHVSEIRDAGRALLHSHESINARFLQYYRSLYSTRVAYTPLDLNSYLDQIDFPKLEPDISSGLDLDITLEEVQEDI